MSDSDIFSLTQKAPLSGNKIRLSSDYGSPEDYAKAVEELHAAFPAENFSTDAAVLDTHGRLANYSKSDLSGSIDTRMY